MIKINLLVVGNLKEEYLKDATKEYSKRLSRFCELNIYETAESRKEEPKLEEGKALLEKMQTGYNIALAIDGKQLSSEELSSNIENLMINGNSQINFIIGGSNGLSQEVLDKCDFKLSFSKMTFPHQLMRVVLLEQIYRAFTIINHITYHK